MYNLLFCPQNEIFSIMYIQRLYVFMQNKLQFIIIWKTCKIILLFLLKDKIAIKLFWMLNMAACVFVIKIL